jgi:protein phosphatase
MFVHLRKERLWQIDTISQWCKADPEILLTPSFKQINLNNAGDLEEAIFWWEQLSDQGIVIRPSSLSNLDILPAFLCRGREYLRPIHGPRYMEPAYLQQISKNNSPRQSMYLQEAMLNLEALARFVSYLPLESVHECVFGVLAGKLKSVNVLFHNEKQNREEK